MSSMHYPHTDKIGHSAHVRRSTECGAFALATERRAHVNCKRCLASLAKRDREFQRKARGRFASAQGREARRMLMLCGAGPSPLSVYPFDAARAIAREEGRAL